MPTGQHGRMRQGWLQAALAASVAVFLTLPASAQKADAPALEHRRPPTLPDEKPTSPNTGESLSDRLKRSDGVIAPPDSGTPDMRVDPPAGPGAGGSMPVIPPPGTPGGAPAPNPK